MRLLLLIFGAVTITAAACNSFLKNEEYTTVQERKQCMDGSIEEAITAMEARELAKKNIVITQNNTTTQNITNGNFTQFINKLFKILFKKPSEDAKKMGKADRLYRDIVNRAERKMFEVKRAKVAKSEGAEARAESLAEILFHRPGSMLTSEEVVQAWEVARNMIFKDFKHHTCHLPTVHLYRTIDGTCNNFYKPLLGSSGTAFKRLLPPSYEDGISSMHGTLQAQNLLSSDSKAPFLPPYPSVRYVSETMVSNMSKDEIPFTHLLMQFGQFLDHDLDLGPEYQGEECHGCTFTDICKPIKVADLDKSFGIKTRNCGNCIPFRRSLTVFPMDAPLTFSPREQLNDVTSFIDGSMIYGSRMERASLVRSFKHGLLEEGSIYPTKASLPIDYNDQVACPDHKECFLCGDNRCNEQISLTIMHTIWLREHNRCAREMATINPHWKDEKLYQVCRKIVGALIQKITYEDYLPKVLGNLFDTFIKPYEGYNDRVDPSIPNSFATAAYRYGHSLIRPSFDRLNNLYEPLPIGPLNLADAFFSPEQFNTSLGTDPITRGWVSVNSRRMDEFLNTVLTTQLFQTPATQGLDLASLNLQRGRDHGLPSYVTHRNFCFNKFGITSDIENDLTLVRFLTLYGSLETAEVWLAGLAEKRTCGDGLLGATFACIFGLTFQAVRDGDRFFWKNPGVFTKAQVKSIQSDSISRVFCDNADDINSIQQDAFRSDQFRISCSELNHVDLKLFQEKSCYIRTNTKPFGYYGRAINSWSRSKTVEFDYYREEIPDSAKDYFSCIPVECPTQSTPTTLMLYYTIPDMWDAVSITPNKFLPPSNYTTSSSLYIADLTTTFFDEGHGMYAGENCKSSSEISFTFELQPTDKLVSGPGDFPGKIFEMLKTKTKNNYPVPDSIEKVNSDLLSNAEAKKQQEIKKTASLFVELEEALKKLP